jgi:hypothetical protein
MTSPSDPSSFSDRPRPDEPEPGRRKWSDSESEPGDVPKLGSLAQAARGKQLNQARGILIAIGILTIVLNAIFLALARDQVEKEAEAEIAKQGGRGRVVINEAQFKQAKEEAVQFVIIANSVAIFLGVLFVIFGLIVKTFPVPVTVLSLVIYIGAVLVFGVLDPRTLGAGIIWKIIIVVALVKAIQTALAYEREKREQPAFTSED